MNTISLCVLASCLFLIPYTLANSLINEEKQKDKENLNSLELKSINKKILAKGEDLPTVALKDGSRVQTGTVATMLFNIKQYDKGIRGDIEKELELAIPTLFKVGLFDLFSPSEWMKGDSPGRKFTGELALKYLQQQKEER